MSDLKKLQQQLENLTQEVGDLRAELRQAFALTDSDHPNMAIVSIGTVLEMIIDDLFGRHVGKPGTKPQANKLHRLLTERVFPSQFKGPAVAVREMRNAALHDRIHYTIQDVPLALQNLLPILKW